mgnify:CR=1 FL=1
MEELKKAVFMDSDILMKDENQLRILLMEGYVIMKILSRCLILIFLAMIIFTMPVMAKSSPIKVFVNGKVLYAVFPVVENSRTLVPIRPLVDSK